MLKSVGYKNALLRTPRTVKRLPCMQVRCSLKPIYLSSIVRGPTATKALVVDAPVAKSAKKLLAQEFDYCLINFDQLADNDVLECVHVADEVLSDESEAQEDDGNSSAYAEWFKAYMSSAYGI